MKVLLVNKYFYPRGGSEAVFFETAALLRERGHAVSFLSMDHPRNAGTSDPAEFVSLVDLDRPGRLLGQAKIAGRMLYSLEARKKLSRLLDREKPDLVHAHNIHHQISPSIFPLLNKRGIPIVMTLHDYKMVCPVYTLFTRGGICERCRGGHYYHCLLRRCTKESFVKSGLNTLEMYAHHRLWHSYRRVSVFISPSRFLKRKVEELGYRGPIVHLPNPVRTDGAAPAFRGREKTIVYSGRLAPEKGLSTLFEALAGTDVRCRVVGDGPLREALGREVRARGLTRVEFLGHLSPEGVRTELRNSVFAVVPSGWYENHPRAVTEAFALGKPVIASRIGGLPELVQEGETGLLFDPGNAADLKSKILSLLPDSARISRMGENARRWVERELHPDRYYAGLMAVYKRALSGD